MKKFINFSLVAMGALAVACGTPELPTIDPPAPPAPVNPSDSTTTDEPIEVVNLIANPNFDEDVDLTLVAKEDMIPGQWHYLGGWNAESANVSQSDNRGVNGSRCLVITSTKGVDVMFGQVVKGLDPSKPYKATVRVKSPTISGGKGANICQEFLWAPSSAGMLTPDNQWHTETLEIDTPPSNGEVTICLRLGSTSADSKGEVYFDNVTLTENTDLYMRESEHCKMMVHKDLVSVSDVVIDEWLSNLDKVYECYVDLFSGRKPFSGRKMVFRSAMIDAWAYAGEPIQWHQNYISHALSQLTKGDWCFGIMHEMGHNFAPFMSGGTYTFDWNEELFANFRMYYALDQLNATVVTDASVPDGSGGYKTQEKTYVGKEIRALYKTDTSNCYDRVIAAGKTEEMGNALCYMLTETVEKYGWDLWKKTYDFLYKIPRDQSQEQTWSDWKRFNYLLEALNKFTPNGEDVRSAFSGGAAALRTIEGYLSKLNHGYAKDGLDNDLSKFDSYVSPR